MAETYNVEGSKTFSVTIKICLLRVICPCPWAVYMYKIVLFFKRCRLKQFLPDFLWYLLLNGC